MFKYLLICSLFCSSFIFSQSEKEPVYVFELFTSQGCSSCPPADKLLQQIKETYKNENVHVLSFHVDYWNRLGWRDPFSKSEYSDYQSAYAYQFKNRNVYTPQLVVNGKDQFTGSDRNRVAASFGNFANKKHNATVNVREAEKLGNKVLVDYNATGSDIKNMYFALVVAERITKIARGENSNRKLANHNIVADFKNTITKSGNIQLQIPNWIIPSDKLTVIAYSKNETGAVTSAHSLAL